MTKKLPTWALILLLILVVGGSALFICAVAGVFDSKKVTLNPEYYASDSSLTLSDGDFLELLTPERLAELQSEKKSFLLFVDQTDCVNADRMREFLAAYTAETGLKPYRILFSDLKNTPLYNEIRYYPSTALISDGSLFAFLNANSDADADAFNDYAAFKLWLDQKLNLET